MRRLTVKQVAAKLGVCPQRIAAKIRQDHFPSVDWCECGHTLLIDEKDLKLKVNKRCVSK